MKDISEAKKYDRSYKEQSVKPALEIGLKRTGEGLKIAYGTLYGWVQAAKNGIYTDTTKTKKSQRTQKYPQYVMDMLWELRKEQDEQCAGIGDKWQDYDHLFIKWDGSPMNNQTPYGWLKEFCEKNDMPFYGIHSFRHFAASALISSGLDVVTVSGTLGHCNSGTTLNVYAHMFQTAQARVAQAMDGAFSFLPQDSTR